MFEFRALRLVSIIYPSSELEIMHHFLCWIPYSMKNSLTKFENFLSIESTGWEPPQLVRRISIKVHYWSRFEFRAPDLALVISPSFELRIVLHFFLDSLLFKEHSIKFLKFFLANSIGWHSVQPVLRASLCRTLFLVNWSSNPTWIGSISSRSILGSIFDSFWLCLGLLSAHHESIRILGGEAS